MEVNLIEVFDREMRCEYKGHVYRVRDNGAVMRLPKEGGRTSPADNVWTFGTKSLKNGYMIFTGDVRVHQVVCTAFHGPAPEPHMVVDHINGNRCDNRPENLRWITREGNTFDNPVTAKKMAYRFGSVDTARELLRDNPEAFRRVLDEQAADTGWMRPSSKAEAANLEKRNERWVQHGQTGPTPGCTAGDWMFTDPIFSEEETAEAKDATRGMEQYLPSSRNSRASMNDVRFVDEYALKESLTPGASQLNWKTPTAFPLCPVRGERTLAAYLENLKPGARFSENRYGTGSLVEEAGYNAAEDVLYVLGRLIDNANPLALCRISFKGGEFIHENIRSYESEIGGHKYFALAMGQEWTGGDCVDDFNW